MNNSAPDVRNRLRITGSPDTSSHVASALAGYASKGAAVVCWPSAEGSGIDEASVLSVHRSVMAGLAAAKELSALGLNGVEHIAIVSDSSSSGHGTAAEILETALGAFAKSLAREMARAGRTVNATSADGTGAEFARQVRFLTSDSASNITGQALGRTGRRIASPAPTPAWTMDTDAWVLVSGGAGMIGEAIVRDLHAAGRRVLIGHVRDGSAQTLAREIDPSGTTCRTVRLDMSDAAMLTATASQLCDEYPDLACVVMCGGWNVTHPFADTDEDEWEKTLFINFTGAALFAAALLKAGGGRNWSFVGIGSESSRIGDAGRAVYAAGKAALASFLSGLARGVPEVHALTVAPGPIDTPLLRSTHADAAAAEKGISRLERLVPLGRLGKPEEIASVVAFVTSAQGLSFNGELISVGGGITMQ